MCGRFIIYSEAQEREILNIVKGINEKFGDNAFKKDEEIFPTDIAPVITSNKSIKGIRLIKWGFFGYKSNSVIINARSETVLEKPMFKESFITRRCLVPASAFFEWKKEGGKKQKFVIHSSTSNLFYMAGIYKDFINKNGESYMGFTILTTAAGDKMSFIHDRMPVMFTEKSEIELWLNTESIEISKLEGLLKPSNDIIIEAV